MTKREWIPLCLQEPEIAESAPRLAPDSPPRLEAAAPTPAAATTAATRASDRERIPSTSVPGDSGLRLFRPVCPFLVLPIQREASAAGSSADSAAFSTSPTCVVAARLGRRARNTQTPASSARANGLNR